MHIIRGGLAETSLAVYSSDFDTAQESCMSGNFKTSQ